MIHQRKSYSLEELSVIGRQAFNLDESWHCFEAEVQGTKIRYTLARKDSDGDWIEGSEEYRSSVPAYIEAPDAISEIKKELKSKIAEIDKRIVLRNGPNFHDENKKVDSLHGEALAYEKVLEMLDKY